MRALNVLSMKINQSDISIYRKWENGKQKNHFLLRIGRDRSCLL